MSGAPTVLSGANCAEIFVPNACASSVWPRLKNDELALPSKSTSMSYQRAPSTSENCSLRSNVTSPKTPSCSSVRSTSLRKMTPSGNGPASEYHPSCALPIGPVTAVFVNG